MIPTQALGSLRVAATLTHSLPLLQARIRLGDEVLLDVVSPARGEHPAGRMDGPVASPCGFRRAVAEAMRDGDDPSAFTLADLPTGHLPVVDIEVPACGEARPGGLYRVPLDGRWLWAFGVTLAATTAHDLGQDLVDAAMPLDGVQAMGIRHDEATSVSLAWAETTNTPGSPGESALIDLLEALLARWTVHQLVEEIGEPRIA